MRLAPVNYYTQYLPTSTFFPIFFFPFQFSFFQLYPQLMRMRLRHASAWLQGGPKDWTAAHQCDLSNAWPPVAWRLAAICTPAHRHTCTPTPARLRTRPSTANCHYDAVCVPWLLPRGKQQSTIPESHVQILPAMLCFPPLCYRVV